MNRQAQEGKFLTGFPVLLLVLVLIGIFIGFSFTLAAVKGSRGLVAEERGTGYLNSVLFLPITVEAQQILVLDAILLADEGTLGHRAVEEGMYSLLAGSKESTCLLIALDDAPDPGGKPGGAARNDFFVKREGSEVHGANFGAFPVLFRPYRDAGVLRETSVLLHDGTRTYVDYYFGRCIQ